MVEDRTATRGATARRRRADDRTEERADERARRREELLDACVACIRAEGPLVSMEQLAAAGGVTKPILYRHFGDRTGLVGALGDRFVDQLAALLSPQLMSDAPSAELLRTTIEAYLELVERDTNLYRFLSDHAGADRRDLVATLVAQQVGIVLAGRLAMAGHPIEPAETWAFGLVGMVHFAADRWSDDRSVSRAQLADDLFRLAWHGLDLLDGTDPGPVLDLPT